MHIKTIKEQIAETASAFNVPGFGFAVQSGLLSAALAITALSIALLINPALSAGAMLAVVIITQFAVNLLATLGAQSLRDKLAAVASK